MESFAADLWRLPPPFNMIVLVVAIIFGVGLVSEVITAVRKYMSHLQDVQLKRDLVDRGLSVDEIERITNAGKKPEKSA
ncbi:MAG: hypothetical protein AAGF31_10875 [Planctomycetota bacterium]